MKKKVFLFAVVLAMILFSIFLFNNTKDDEVVLKNEVYLDYGNSFPSEIDYYVESGDTSLINKYQFDYKYDNIENTNIPEKGTYSVKVTYQIKNKEYEQIIIVVVR